MSERPSSPASNFMVGVQRPKSSSEIVDGVTPDAADEVAAAADDVAATAIVARVVGTDVVELMTADVVDSSLQSSVATAEAEEATLATADETAAFHQNRSR